MRLEVAKKTIQSREYALWLIESQLEFLRPSSQDDMECRLKQYNEFSKQIKAVVPDDLHLCFHGCPIYAAKHIIEDREISSSVDRVGSSTRYDVSDQVSVTTKKYNRNNYNGDIKEKSFRSKESDWINFKWVKVSELEEYSIHPSKILSIVNNCNNHIVEEKNK